MRKKINILFVVATLLFVFGCKTQSGSSSGFNNTSLSLKNTSLKINLQSPINSPDGNSANNNQNYLLVQNKANQFKDNAPFVQYLEGGKRERLWFSSSRPDASFFGKKHTNLYQQVYYVERTIEGGKCTAEGWSAPTLFTVDNPSGSPIIDAFNKATKGAVSIANGLMILSCDQFGSDNNQELKQLWSVDVVDGKFENPRQIFQNQVKAWDSQPALSPNGKHLFFVSNRNTEGNENVFSKNLNIFYSFNNNGSWTSPVLVNELSSEYNDITPQFSPKADKLLFSIDKSGDFDIYVANVTLNDNTNGYTIDKQSISKFNSALIDLCSNEINSLQANDKFNQKYPFHYYNPENKSVPQALFWSSDNPAGLGGYDVYACAMPFIADVRVVLVDCCKQGGNQQIDMPIIELTGAAKISKSDKEASFKLYSGLEYKILGGSKANKGNGTYYCDRDDRYIFIGYCRLMDKRIPEDKKLHTAVIDGAQIESVLTEKWGKMPLKGILSDTIVHDTIYITKAWAEKPICPEVLEIPQKHHSIAYFQTGFWEVNTSENLKRDLELLHDGFELTPVNDIYNPQGIIKANRSGYKAFDWETPISPINTKDVRTYSIADARWIELHPFNFYWGDRPDYRANISQRMKGRKERIAQYIDYATKVDENLKMLTDTIKDKYIDFLELHKDAKPKLLIEIFAVSDQREVLRGWYIGDTVKYRGSSYLGNNKFSYEPVKIIPPKVDEKTKTLVEIKPCSIELNADGDNGCVLGISSNKTEMNTNLSRLRAWFGYKEVYDRLASSESFKKYLKEGKVALPDNSVSYDDAEIIILTQGRRIDIINPKSPYPASNNPNGQGFYDFDQIRRVEIRIRLLMDKKEEKVKDYCCFSSKK